MNELLLHILLLVLTQISPDVKKDLQDLLSRLESLTKATPNPWDDVLVGILKTLLTVPEG